jgi:hypothetical protein
LRLRVNELLKQPEAATQANEPPADDVEDLEDFDPYDPTHLFWEQLKQLGFAFREIRREDVLDKEIEELLKASEPIIAVLSKIQRVGSTGASINCVSKPFRSVRYANQE